MPLLRPFEQLTSFRAFFHILDNLSYDAVEVHSTKRLTDFEQTWKERKNSREDARGNTKILFFLMPIDVGPHG